MIIVVSMHIILLISEMGSSSQPSNVKDMISKAKVRPGPDLHKYMAKDKLSTAQPQPTLSSPYQSEQISPKGKGK